MVEPAQSTWAGARVEGFVPIRRLGRRGWSEVPSAPSPGRPGGPRAAGRWPTYWRVVSTTVCNMRCSYCHMEGDPGQLGSPRGLSLTTLERCFGVLARVGARKVKFLGGEPLVRGDFPQVVEKARLALPRADLSVITAGAVPQRALREAFAAGVDRINLSIHGFGLAAFEARGNPTRLFALRRRSLDELLELGRPLKLNYVYSGPEHDEDLRALLAWTAPRGVLVNVLDDLTRDLGPAQLIALLEGWFGPAAERERDRDPDSLDTARLRWAGGPWVEIKDRRLGESAPWRPCGACPARPRCKEGIYALRLNHDGWVAPCLDRQDLGFSMVAALERGSVESAAAELRAWLGELLGPQAEPAEEHGDG